MFCVSRKVRKRKKERGEVVDSLQSSLISNAPITAEHRHCMRTDHKYDCEMMKEENTTTMSHN